MVNPNNPLKQFFRKPAVYLRLPSGGNYAPGVINMPENGELPIYPMTALDEITVRTPDALFNGEAVSSVIRSCAPNVLDPWRLNNIDLDALLISIRSASEGSELEIDTVCPNCNEEAKYGLNLTACLSQLSINAYQNELSLGDLAIKFKSLTYKEINYINNKQFEIQKLYTQIENIQDLEEKSKRTKDIFVLINEATNVALAKSIEYIKTPSSVVTEQEFILEFLLNCDSNTYEIIKEENVSIKKNSEIQPLDIKCIHCQHEYKQLFTFNMSDFFG